MKGVVAEPHEHIVTPVVPSHPYASPVKPPSSSKKRPSSRSQEDDDWVLDTPKRRPARCAQPVERKLYDSTPTPPTMKLNVVSSTVVVATPVAVAASIPTEPIICSKVIKQELVDTPPTTPVTPPINNNRRLAAIKRESEKKKHQQQLNVSYFLIFIYFFFVTL